MKVRLVENCPVLNEKDFKDAIRENFRDAKKFDYPLSEAQVYILPLSLFAGSGCHFILVGFSVV